MMLVTVETEELTPPQQRFAHEHDAYAQGRSADGNVFLYREGDTATERWLVDDVGRLVDYMRLHRSPE